MFLNEGCQISIAFLIFIEKVPSENGGIISKDLVNA
ncbi:hypothetical protein MASRES_GEN12946_13685 [Acinetobacter baumannii]